MKAIWDSYPATYRAVEVGAIRTAVEAGECVSLVGLSGAGKSNLLGFISGRISSRSHFVLIDCNRLTQPTLPAFFDLVAHAVEPGQTVQVERFADLERLLKGRVEFEPGGCCLMLDRFDGLAAAGIEGLEENLRALRDTFKYWLTYVVATRHPLTPHSELSELFYAHTVWLSPLNLQDARWSAGEFANRHAQEWSKEEIQTLINISWGYPSLLRAVCEAYAAGAVLDPDSLLEHTSLRKRVAEFWSDHPTSEELRLSGLEGHPLLTQQAPVQVDPSTLTAAENRLWDYLMEHAGEVCTKDELMQAVWSGEVQQAGLRDDSLAQLVHRLRDKVESDPSHPRSIQTIAGRGYRYNPML